MENPLNPKDRQEMEKVAAGILHKMASEGKSLKETIGVSDQLLEEVYGLAYAHYNQGKYKEAVPLFQFLTGVSPENYKFVLGLAASLQQIGDLENAKLGFFIALNIDPSNPWPAYYIADAFLKENNREAALEFLEITFEIASENDSFNILKERSRLLINSLNN